MARKQRENRDPVELAPLGVSVTERGAVMVRFAEKPSDHVRASLREAGFRWNRNRVAWIHKATDERVEFAKRLIQEVGEEVLQ